MGSVLLQILFTFCCISCEGLAWSVPLAVEAVVGCFTDQDRLMSALTSVVLAVSSLLATSLCEANTRVESDTASYVELTLSCMLFLKVIRASETR